jgi:hypothetical protein
VNVLVGYLAATRAARPDWADAGLPDADLVSMSECMVDVIVAPPWDQWFTEPPAAPPGHHVLAVGVPDHYLAALRTDLAAWFPPTLTSPRPLPDWPALGYELVGLDHGRWHTWLCLDGLVDAVRQATGVLPGPWGLIPDEHDARRAADWLTASGLGDPKVFLWVPALLLSPVP